MTLGGVFEERDDRTKKVKERWFQRFQKANCLQDEALPPDGGRIFNEHSGFDPRSIQPIGT